VLLEEKWLPAVPPEARGGEAPVYVADRALLEQITGYAVHRGALAAMERLPLPPVDVVVDGATLLVVLEDINNHTNIGAIFRSAAGLGADGVLLSPRCADPLYRRAVRVSMGSVFSLPYARFTAWPEGLLALRELGLTILALTPAPDAVRVPDLGPGALGRCALLFGAEGPGLTAAGADLADLRVRIPMTHGVDSLNVAAAAAVACYAVAMQREAPARGPH
jgi:tRNA G18 (ribose-2'-O)-methylase SpoU